MAFMSATLSDFREYFLISDDLEDAVFCRYNGINLPVGVYDEDDVRPEDENAAYEITNVFNLFPSVHQFEVVYKFWGQLSASGYMDQTDYCLGDSQADVAQQLLDMYFDVDEEDMDEDEKEDRAWLESIVEEGACTNSLL